MSKPKLMITGAAGFIATAFWRQFQHKYDLFGVDRYSPVSQIDERQHFTVMERDCQNVVDMEMAIQQSGAKKLLHMASSSHNDTSFHNPLQFYRDNVMGTAAVFEAARRQGIERIYLVSTDEVLCHYAPLSPESTVLESWFFEGVIKDNVFFHRAREHRGVYNHKYSPSSPYSSSKACQEMIANAYIESYGLDIVIIRPTNVYGPGQYPEKLISKAITDLLSGKKVQIYGEGAQWRDYTYISDTCDALDLIISQEEPKPIYHIAANDERQNISTVKEILQQMGKTEDWIEFIEDPRGNAHDFSYSLSSARIRELGWAPKVSFEEGISRTIDYYRNKG